MTRDLTKCETRLKTPSLVAPVRKMLEENKAFLLKQIADVERQIQDHIDKNDGLKENLDLLESIPGVGKITACRILAEMPQQIKTTKSSSLAAYAGLAPRVRESGSSVHRSTRMSKCGNSHLTGALYWPAIVVIRCNPVVRTFALRLLAKGKAKLAVIGAAMRKLLMLAFGVLKTHQKFDTHYADKIISAA